MYTYRDCLIDYVVVGLGWDPCWLDNEKLYLYKPWTWKPEIEDLISSAFGTGFSFRLISSSRQQQAAETIILASASENEPDIQRLSLLLDMHPDGI